MGQFSNTQGVGGVDWDWAGLFVCGTLYWTRMDTELMIIIVVVAVLGMGGSILGMWMMFTRSLCCFENCTRRETSGAILAPIPGQDPNVQRNLIQIQMPQPPECSGYHRRYNPLLSQIL